MGGAVAKRLLEPLHELSGGLRGDAAATRRNRSWAGCERLVSRRTPRVLDSATAPSLSSLRRMVWRRPGEVGWRQGHAAHPLDESVGQAAGQQAQLVGVEVA